MVFDGKRSYDPDKDRLTFSWTQISGIRKVFLRGDSAPIVTFRAPFVPVNNSMLVFRLTVKDSAGLNSSDSVRINVQKTTKGIVDNPPVASAGRDQAVLEKMNVTLDGSKSIDLDVRDKLTYRWKQIGGVPSVTIHNDTQSIASFISPEVSANTTLKFALTVSDPRHKNSTDIVNVVVMKPEGLPPWVMPGIGAVVAGVGVAVWAFFFRKRPKPRLKFVP